MVESQVSNNSMLSAFTWARDSHADAQKQSNGDVNVGVEN